MNANITLEQFKKLQQEIDEAFKAFDKAATAAEKTITEFATALHRAEEEYGKIKADDWELYTTSPDAVE